MKTIFSALLLTLFISFGNTPKAFSQTVKTQNYVVLTKKVPQLKPILLAAKSLKKEDGENFGKFEIIFCGKNIGDLTQMETLKPHIEAAETIGANIIACGFSLKKFNVEANKLPKEIEIVDNGILHNLHLQQKGYLSLEL